MVPDLTLEVIYLNEPTDFKMEFELCSSLNVRFLSLPVKSRSEFLAAISKSVVRSRTIITVGSFNPLDKLYIPKIIAKATGYELEIAENENLKIDSNVPMPLPEGSLPLVDENGNLCGCVLENNDQSIIMLTSDRELRHNVVTNLVCPYLKLFAQKKTKEFNTADLSDNSNTAKAKAQIIFPPQTELVNAEQANPIPEQAPDVSEVAEQSLEAENTEIEKPNQSTEFEQAEALAEPKQEAPAEPRQENQEVTLENSELHQTDFSDLPKYFIMEQPEQNTSNHFGLDELLIESDDVKKSKGSKKTRAFFKIFISIILVLAVALASYFGYDRVFQPMQHTSVYEEVKALYGQKWSKLPENMFYKFGKLYQTNSDVFGWLSLPDTAINLPVVSSAKKSAAYYRSHLFDGSVNRYGTLYTTSQLSAADYNRNLLIYGKNMGDGTMFSELENFLDIDVYKNAPTFTFDTLYFENKWKIFSVFKVNSKNKNSYLKTNFFDDNEFSNYLEQIQDVSAIKTNIDVTYTDQIVTLVSLGEVTDVILVARKVRDGESPMVDVTGTYENYLIDNSSEIPVIATPLEPIETSSKGETVSDIVDPNMVDGASSRYEQQAPVSSSITLKPTTPTISSVPELPSSKPSSSKPSSSKPSSSKPVSSKNPTVTSNSTSSAATSSGSIVANNLPMLTVTNTFNGEKVKGNALDIIAQNVEAEMGSSYHIEALKAQAVAAYSWLLNNGSANNKYPSLPLKKPSQKSIDAVNAVAGQVAVYGGKVATTFYYAISAGKTAYAKDIWGGSYPHLVSVDSSVDKNVSGYQTVRKYSAAKVAEIAKSLLDIDLTKISDKSKWFSCSYDVNGLYCAKVKIGSVEKKGTYLRDTFFNASRVGASNVLRSSAYTISYNESEDVFIFTVKGYGHGVGMSQAGANQYAKNGWTYDKILKHYFTGITLGTYYI